MMIVVVALCWGWCTFRKYKRKQKCNLQNPGPARHKECAHSVAAGDYWSEQTQPRPRCGGCKWGIHSGIGWRGVFSERLDISCDPRTGVIFNKTPYSVLFWNLCRNSWGLLGDSWDNFCKRFWWYFWFGIFEELLRKIWRVCGRTRGRVTKKLRRST